MRIIVDYRTGIGSNRCKELAWICPEMLICCHLPPFSDWMRARFTCNITFITLENRMDLFYSLLFSVENINTEENWLIWHQWWLLQNDSRWMARCDQQWIDQLICSKIPLLKDRWQHSVPLTNNSVPLNNQTQMYFLTLHLKSLARIRRTVNTKTVNTIVFFLFCICVSAFRPYWCFAKHTIARLLHQHNIWIQSWTTTKHFHWRKRIKVLPIHK